MNKIEWLEFYASGVIMGFMCLFGITANTLTLFVLNGFSEMRRQSINVYLTVLAIYDNGVLINAFLMLSLPNIIRGMERLSDAYQYETLDPMSFHHHESISSSSFFPDEFSPILSSGSSKNDVGGSATSGLIDKIVGHHQLFDDNGNTIKSDELMLSMQGYSLSESEAQDPMNDDDKFNRTILELGETAYNSLIINISSPLTTYSLSSFSSSSSSSPSTSPSSSSAPSSSPSILSDNSGDSVSVYNDEQDVMDSRPHSMMADRVQTYYVEIVYPLALISQTGSIWTTCLITAERYFAVCHPIKIRTFANRARAVWAVTILSLLAILYNIPRFFEVEVVNYNGTLTVQQTTLRSDRIYFNFYYIFCYLTLLYIIPLSVLSMLNVKIYQAVRKANRNRASLTNQEESELNIASMLVLLVSIFLACNAPAFFVNCLELIDPRSDFYIAATNLSNLLVCFNSSVNFFIYCIFGKKFRHKLRQVLCCRKVQHAHRCASRTVLPSNSTHIVDGTCV